MTLEIHPLDAADAATLETFLLPRLETSMFLLGNMRAAGLRYTGERYTGNYVAAFEDNVIVSVAAHYWNHILILQAPSHLDVLWRAALQTSGRPIKGVIGPHAQVEEVKAALNPAAAIVQMDECEQLYGLALTDLIVPDALRTGQVVGRRAAAGDVETLTRWRVGYEIEALREQPSPQLWEQERAMADRLVRENNTWVLQAAGQPVATSAFNTRLKEVVQIGGVWTPPELRGRGYARCVVAQSLLDARAEGVKKAILFTGADNLPAQKAYTALGFRHIGDYHLLMLREPLRMSF